MHPIRSNSNRYIRSRIDQQAGSERAFKSAGRGSFSSRAQGLLGQFLQRAGAQVPLAKLDEVDTALRGFDDLSQKQPSSRGFATCELRSVSDVVEKTAFSQHGPRRLILN